MCTLDFPEITKNVRQYLCKCDHVICNTSKGYEINLKILKLYRSTKEFVNLNKIKWFQSDVSSQILFPGVSFFEFLKFLFKIYVSFF